MATKRILMVVIAVILGVLPVSVAMAQIDVSSTAGTTSGSYTSLKQAFDFINAGYHQGVITITVSANTVEPVTAVLLPSTFPSSYSQITISPGGGSPRSITGNIAGPLISLQGASHVVIDGLNSGGNSLTIENTNTTGGAGTGTGASTIQFINDATNDTIRNTTVNGGNSNTPASQTGTIYFGTTTGTLGNSNNAIMNCDIGPSGLNTPVNAIYSAGSTTSTAVYNRGNALLNNSIHDFFVPTASSAGIYITTGNTDWTISGNSLYQTAARVQTAQVNYHYGMYIYNTTGAGNFTITGNFVGGSAPNCGGTPWTYSGTVGVGFEAIYLASVTASVQGNTVANFSTNATGGWRGIDVVAGVVNIGGVTGNTIGSPTGNGSITLTMSSAGTNVWGINAAVATGSTVANNTVGSFNIAGAGMYCIAATYATIVNNIVGSLTTPNSINLTQNGTFTSMSVIGFNTVLVPTMTGNIAANITNANATSTMYGFNNSLNATSCTVTGNTIHDFKTTAGTGATVVGIYHYATGGVQNVSHNTIYNLSSASATLATGTVAGIQTAISAGTTSIAGNLIHSLSAANVGAGILGIQVQSGIGLFTNNIIRLGVDSTGASIPTGCLTYGFSKSSTGATGFYHNSVLIAGTATSGTANSAAYFRGATGVDSVRNNILVNLRQGGSGKHFALLLNAVAATDYNIYNVATGSPNVASINAGATALTMQGLRASTGSPDVHSGIGDPRWVAPLALASTMSFDLQNPTPAEGTGIPIASVTDDFGGRIRSLYTPVDIGAYAVNSAMDASTDIFTPSIIYTALPSTSLLTDITLTATITDNAPVGGGVPTSGLLAPRIWYKKFSSPTWTLSNAGTLVSGDGRNGVWSFTILASALLPAGGDSIQYYVVAQDQATIPNIWYNPVAATSPIHSDVNTQTTPPVSPYGYKIIPGYAGTYYVPNNPGGVPASQVYPTLTQAGGFFAAVNAGRVFGNINVIINGDVVETGATVLNAWAEDGVGGYTMKIQPDGTTPRTLSMTTQPAGVGILSFNGAKRVIVDGSFGGTGKYLVLRASVSVQIACVYFTNNAANDTIRNCVLESSETSTNVGTVSFGISTNGTGTNIQIANNDIRDLSVGTGTPNYGMYVSGTGFTNLSILNNNFYNFNVAGIYIYYLGSGHTIQGNSFYSTRTTAPTTSQYSIYSPNTTGGGGLTINGNYIGGSAPMCGGTPYLIGGTGYFYGMYFGATSPTVASQFEGNVVRNILSTSTGAFYGIYIGGGLVDIGGITGNVIGDPATANSIQLTNGVQSYGIYIVPAFAGVSAPGGLNISNNSVMNISSTGTGNFYGIHIGVADNATSVSSVINNTVQALSFTGTSATQEFRGISLVGAGATPANGAGMTNVCRNTIGHNSIANSISVAGGAGATGIYVTGANTAAVNDSGNVVANINSNSTASTSTVRGIVHTQGLGSIYGNTIHDLVSGSTSTTDGLTGSALGLYAACSGAAGSSISGNTIYAIRNTTASATTTITSGIVGGTGTAAASISRNRIYDLTNTSTGVASAIKGINQLAGTWTLANNEISVTNGANTNPILIAGISSSSAGSFYYNSVYIGGSQTSGTASSYSFVRQTNVSATLLNNLLYNERINTAPATGTHAAIACLSPGFSQWSSNYNVLIAANAGSIGRSSILDLSFATLKTTSLGETNSLSEIAATIPSATLFTSAVNGILDIATTLSYDPPPIVSNAGIAVAGQTTDFGGVVTRSSTPDIGANEIVVSRTLTTAGSLLPASSNYPGNYDAITVDAGGAATLAGSVNIFGSLNFLGGNITTGANILTIQQGATVVRTTGHVVGNLRKAIPIGAGVSQSFEIGSGAIYAPVTVTAGNVTTAGTITATTIGTDHPNLSTSHIDPTHSVNRYWTLTNGGTVFDTVNAVYTFDPSDLDAGVTIPNLLLEKYSASTWTAPTMGAKTATSIEVKGLTGFGDFAIGDPALPPPPVLVSPVDFSTGVLVTTSFQWNTSTGASAYGLQVATDSAFTAPIINQTGLTGTTFTPAAPLLINTIYYWRVNASNLAGTGTWSAFSRFTSENPPLPLAPVMLSPANASSLVSRTTSFAWNASANALTYAIQVASDSAFTAMVASDSLIAATSFTPVAPLPGNTILYWRVNGRNAAGAGAWSAFWSFTTVFAIPDTVQLTAPANAATGVSLTPAYTWNAALRAATYDLQVATDTGFTAIVDNQTGLTATTYTPVTPLANNTLYHWRVRSVNNGGVSAWCSSFGFTTVALPAVPVVFSPMNLGTGVPITTTFQWNASAGAVSYGLEVATDAGFTAIIITQSGLTTTSYTPAAPLTLNTAYYWRVNATNTGGTSAWSAPATFRTALVNQSTHFLFTANTGVNATVSLPTSANPNLDGSPIVSGDEIGVYTSTGLCVGGIVWTGTNASITVWGDNTTTPAIDGMTLGQQMYFRLWKQATGIEYISVGVAYSSGNGIYLDNSIHVLSSFTAASNPPAVQNIIFSPGWNIASGYVTPTNSFIDTVSLSVLANLTIVKNGAGLVYWPSFAINMIGTWNNTQGYQYNVTTGDTLILTGTITRPETSPIALAAGWNMIGYLRYSPMRADSSFAGIVANITLVKDNFGQVYWPLFGINTIGSLMPGQGYQIYTSSAVSLTYPANTTLAPRVMHSGGTPIPIAQSVIQMHFNSSQTRTGANATIVARMSFGQDGDEIAVRTREGMFVGAGIVNAGKALVTVWGDNTATPDRIDGAVAGEELSFVYWSAAEKKERYLTIDRVTDGLTGKTIGSELSYETDAAMIVDLSRGAAIPTAIGSIGNIPSRFVLEQNYPNPFNPKTTIYFGLPQSAHATLEVFNILGVRVALLVDELKPAGYHEVSFDAAHLSSGVYFYRLTAGTYTDIRKMMLLK